MAEGQQLNELSFMSWPLNDNDLLVMEDVSDPLPLRKIRLCTVRSALVGGWPRLEDVPEGVVTPPTWSLKGIEGGWRIRIHNRISDAKWYFLHKWDHASEKYISVKAIPESRDPHEEGTPNTPLIYDYFAPITDTLDRYYGKFKVQSVSHEYQGALSDAQECWTLYDLPSDWLPDAPTLLTTGGYPLVSRSLLPDGGLGYTISLKIQAPADQKNLLKEYVIDRVCDEGDSFEGKPTKTNTLVLKGSPRPKIVIWNDTDRSFVPGYQYRYTVYAKALNDNLGPVSNTQDKTLTDDTTAPDDPVFTVTTSPGNIEVVFDPIEVGGNPDVGWAYIQLQYRIDEGDWTDVILDKTLSHVFSVAEADYADEYEFQAKVFDYAGNVNAGGWQTDENTYTAGFVTELCFGTELGNKITQIGINQGNITTHETEITQNATDILLRATKTYVDGEVTTLESSISVNAGNILLRVQWDGDETSIQLSEDGTHIHSDYIIIDGNVEITGAAVIQGILHADGGIKTSAGGNRIELGNYASVPDRLTCYLTGDKRITMAGHVLTFYDTLGASKLQMSSQGLSGGTGCFLYTQSYMKALDYIRTDDVFKVGANQVLGARRAHIADAVGAVGDPPTQAEFNTFVGKFNFLLSELEGHGQFAAV